MLIRGAVLEEIGRARPYAESRPITISELDLDAPGDGELLVASGAGAEAAEFLKGEMVHLLFQQDHRLIHLLKLRPLQQLCRRKQTIWL